MLSFGGSLGQARKGSYVQGSQRRGPEELAQVSPGGLEGIAGFFPEVSDDSLGRWRLPDFRGWPRPGTFDIVSDNQTVAAWTGGRAPSIGPEAFRGIDEVMGLVDEVFEAGFAPRRKDPDPVWWAPREVTAAADPIYNRVLDNRREAQWISRD